MALIGGGAVHVIEPVRVVNDLADRVVQSVRRWRAIEMKLHRFCGRRGDGEQEVRLVFHLRADDKRGRSPEMGERVPTEGEAFGERAGREIDAPQQLPWLEHI